MTVYGSQIALALRLIKQKGQQITLLAKAVDDFNPVTDSPGTVTLSDQLAYALVLPPSTMTEQSYADQFAAGTMVRSRTRVLTIAAGDLTWLPAEGYLAQFEGAVWTFVGVKITAPDGAAIIVEGTVKR